MARADLAAVRSHRPEIKCFHHPTGASWDREALLTLNRQVTSARGLKVRTDYLATLGAALVLIREWSSWESLGDETLGPFGAVERERIIFCEVDASGRQRRVEFFAADHLGDAIARAYARHAELLPDGRARDRAAATASAVLTVLAPDLRRYPAAFAPDIEFHDHRTPGSARTWRRRVGAWLAALVASPTVSRLRTGCLAPRIRRAPGPRGSPAGSHERQHLRAPAINLFCSGPTAASLATRPRVDTKPRIARFDALTAVRACRAITRRATEHRDGNQRASPPSRTATSRRSGGRCPTTTRSCTTRPARPTDGVGW
jgi:hypothetical protein